MTEKKTATKTKTTVKNTDEKPGVAKDKQPAEVAILAKELEIDPTTLLGWNIYPDRVVIISSNGMKFSKVLNGSKSN
jgi:hypothetical protein